MHWYVRAPGIGEDFSGNNGFTQDTLLPTVQAALTNINGVYTANLGRWPVSGSEKEAAAIIVSGEIKKTVLGNEVDMVTIEGVNAYPPILLRGGSGGGILNANGDLSGFTITGRVLKIRDGNTVTLGKNLTLTGGIASTDDMYWTPGKAGGGVLLDTTVGTRICKTGGIIEDANNTSFAKAFLAQGGLSYDLTIPDDVDIKLQCTSGNPVTWLTLP